MLIQYNINIEILFKFITDFKANLEIICFYKLQNCAKKN